jgi:plastocyanin
MTIDDTSLERRQPCSPADQELSLGDQIKYVVYGYPLHDVAAVATGLLMHVSVQITKDKEEALRFLRHTLSQMHVVVDRDYEQIASDARQLPEQ